MWPTLAVDLLAKVLVARYQDPIFRKCHPDDRLIAPVAAPKADAKPEEKKPASAWEPDLDDLAARTVRLTPFSSGLQFYKLTPDGKSFVFASVGAATGFVGYKLPLGKLAVTLVAAVIAGSVSGYRSARLASSRMEGS